MSASSGRITAWDIPDSMRLGHDYAADMVLRRSLCETPLSARLTFARDGSVRIQVCLGFFLFYVGPCIYLWSCGTCSASFPAPWACLGQRYCEEANAACH